MQMLKIVEVQNAISAKLMELNVSPLGMGANVNKMPNTLKRDGVSDVQAGNAKKAKGEPSTPSRDDSHVDEVLGNDVKTVFVVEIEHVQASSH